MTNPIFTRTAHTGQPETDNEEGSCP